MYSITISTFIVGKWYIFMSLVIGMLKYVLGAINLQNFEFSGG